LEERGMFSGQEKDRWQLFTGIRPLDRIVLVRNLAVTLKAGLSIVEAVEVLIKDATRRGMRQVLNSAKFSLERGQPLSAVFAAYSQFFPPIFVGLVRAGENSGKLDKSLDELAQQLTKEFKLVRKIKSAMAYPLILLVGSVGVVALLLTFVLPRLIKVFQLSGVKLPVITQVFIFLSNILTYSYWLDAGVIAFLVWFFLYFRRTEWGRKIVLRVLFHTPLVKELVKKIALVRFTRVLSGLVGSGVNIVEALQLSAQAVGNVYYRIAILDSLEQIKNGVPLSETLQNKSHLFPNLLINMVTVGEKTGTLDYVLKTFSDFYDEEIDNTLKDLTTVLEPLLLLIMGVIIGAVALSILLPIYQLVGNFV
jgi:type II secretory pathway component PulF